MSWRWILIDVGVLHFPAIRRVAAVQDVAEFALGDAVRVVVAARDGAARLRLRQIDFVLAELGRGQHVLEDAQHLIGIFLEARERKRSRSLADGLSTDAAMFSKSRSI